MRKITLGSLFDGIGAFPIAASCYGITAVWASEIMPAAVSITRRHFPDMVHMGDITKLSGYNLPPVDILTFGSPCQDLSTASGKRAGLAGARSSLFMEALRIIKEMRCVTNGKSPRYAIWENVPGCFSSNGRRDYKIVLEAFTETELPMPKFGRWANAGMVRSGNVDLSWCIYNAVNFGLAQRRKRVFLVADFGGRSSGEILFVPKSLSWDSAESGEAWQGITSAFGTGINLPERSKSVAVFNGGASPQSGSIAYSETVSPTLKSVSSGLRTPCVCEPKFARTLTARGDSSPCADRGQNVVVHPKVTGTLCSSAAGLSRPGGMGSETDLTVAYCIQGTTIGRADENGPNGGGFSENKSYTLTSTDKHAVAVDCRNLRECGEKSATIQSGYSLNCLNPVRRGFVVRRLTPTECERLMGMPDGYTRYGNDGKEISDSKRYSMLGNSIAVPCAAHIMKGIAEQYRKEDSIGS